MMKNNTDKKDKQPAQGKSDKHKKISPVSTDNAHFVVSEEDYNSFHTKLRRPPRDIPALRELLKTAE